MTSMYNTTLHNLYLVRWDHVSSDCLLEVINNRESQTGSSKSGHGRLWEVDTCERFQL